jgi:sulfoxide reductase heme-binding subunit YedZ
MAGGRGVLAAEGFTDPVLWFANRGTGVVLVVLLTLSMVMGVFSTVRASTPRWPRFATQALHRNISLLTAAMLAGHVATAVIDEFVPIRWFDAFIPVTGKYQPFWLGMGALALDLILIVVVTSLVRDRLGHRGWRAIHMLTYVAWGLGVLHGVGIGTDSETSWGAGVTIASIGAVGVAVIVRGATYWNERRLAA